jgi:hypothetical protein
MLAPRGGEMEFIENNLQKHMKVVLDENKFVNCKIYDCTLANQAASHLT